MLKLGESMKFTVSEIAFFFGNTKGAVRFYEEQGLIHPKRDKSGNRVYGYRDFLQLFYLKRYQKVGFTMRDTAEYFTSDSSHSLEEVIELTARRKEELQQQIVYLTRCSDWLVHYYEDLEKIKKRNFTVEMRELGDFYYLDEDFFAAMDKDAKKVLAEWIALIPFVTLHTDLIRVEDGFEPRLGIGIFADYADLCGLTIPSKAKLLKKAKVLTCIIEKNGKDFETDLSEDVKRIYCEYQLEPYLIPSYSLVYSHQMKGEELKYYRIFIPVAGNKKAERLEVE